MANKKDLIFIIVETDDNDTNEVDVAQKSFTDYDHAYKHAETLANKYVKDCGLKCEVTGNLDEGKIDVDVMGQYHHYRVMSVPAPVVPKTNPKLMDAVTVVCYNQREDFKTREQAIKKYTAAVNGCDPNSSECARYNAILNQLYAGKKVANGDI